MICIAEAEGKGSVQPSLKNSGPVVGVFGRVSKFSRPHPKINALLLQKPESVGKCDEIECKRLIPKILEIIV